MADERDPKVSQRYRELPAEEPPRELDQTILAAAHRSVDRPHAPLVTPAGRHRWYYAFGAAAILVLAVAVTVQIERQQPDPETASAPSYNEAPLPSADSSARQEQAPMRQQPASSAPAAPAVPPASEAQRPAQDQAKTPQGSVPPPTEASPHAQVQTPAQDRGSPPAASEPEVTGRADRLERRARAAPQAAPPAGGIGGLTSFSLRDEPPERWIERIVQLRKDGRHEEADKLLVDFKQRFPDYKLPENVVRP